MIINPRSRRRRLLALALVLPLTLSVAGGMAAADSRTAPAAENTVASELPWMDTSLAPTDRADLLIAAMTPDQKFQQVAMEPIENPEICPYYRLGRHVEGIPELEIPTLRMTNGPGGGGGDCAPEDMSQTNISSEIGVAASFDLDVAAGQGTLIGQEAVANAHNIFLGIGVNMGRVPNLGRNYEYYGEDPYLTGAISSAKVRAVQAEGVQATAKHFAANEQETNRRGVNTVVDERTLRELYLLPFEMNIKDADVAAVMCSYPRIDEVYACENAELLTTLRDEIGFTGYVMSDRGATQSTVPSVKAGLDLEFASPRHYTPELLQAAIDSGEISMDDIDEMLHRRFTVMFRLGQFENPLTETFAPDLDANALTARGIAQDGAVLLKNDGDLLPLDGTSLASVAVIGPETFAGSAKFPTGPGFVAPEGTLTPTEGLQQTLDELGSSATVTYNDGTDLAAAAALAAESDLAIVMVGDISQEGRDRQHLNLPESDGVDQETLISAVASANDDTVVVLKNGGPIVTPWLDDVPAVLEVWYPGQEDGLATAGVLLGLTNPGGKLPLTFPGDDGSGPISTPEQFPGVVDADGLQTVTYSEKLEMGYRWYDANEVAPKFAFGHGLSYTDFEISKLTVTPRVQNGTEPIKVQFFVENTGEVAGAEVPQVYLGLPESAGEPPKRLVGFDKVQLEAGEKQRVSITIDPSASNHPLSVWDVDAQGWATPTGQFDVFVGNSSDNITLQDSVTVRTPAGR